MAILTLSNISKSFGDRELFKDVSFFVNERERVALIGANGTGKSTLLKIICGEMSADYGGAHKQPGATMGYLPQDVDLPETASLHLAVMGFTNELMACASEFFNLQKKMEAATEDQAHALGSKFAEVSHQFDSLHGFDYHAQAKAILKGLGFDESDLDIPVHALSGGQKTRAALARLLLLSPDMLLLDEPTNHLDIQACEWLQEFLQTRYQGAALIVSHDRYFMDQVVDRVVELDAGEAIVYTGNYSAYAKKKAERIEEQQKLYKEQQKEIKRIEQAIQTLFSHRKFSRRDSKVKQLERMQRVGKVQDHRGISANLASSVRSGREVVRLSKLSKSYPGKKLFEDVNFVVERGQKIGIVGPNGSGKTTMLKVIAERIRQDSGEVIFGHNVKPVYFAQEFDHLSPNRTVLDELLYDSDISAKEARDLLARFLFMGDDAFKTVDVLSGGELCRLALAKVLADKPNLLLLDEPTNHLDIDSRESLEDALRAFDGTVVVASHDRYLLDAIATDIVEIKDGRFTHFLGNYSAYRSKSKQTESDTPTAAAKAKPVKSEEQKSRPVSSLRDLEKQIRDLSKKRKSLETEIEESEERIQELTTALGDEENYRNGSVKQLTEEYDTLSSRLHQAYAEWEEVCEKISELEEQAGELV